MAKDYRGQEEVFGFFGRLMDLTSGTFRVETIDMLADDAGGVFLDRLTADRGGRKRDLVEGLNHFHHEHLWDASWS